MKKHLFSSFLFLVSLLLVCQLAFPSVHASALIINNVLPPSNLSSQLITPSEVKLTWNSVYGATGYNVYGIIDGQLKLLSTTTSTSYTFNNLQEGSYSYVVSTLSADGESGPCAPVSVNVVYPNMAAPLTLTNKLQNGNDITLSWAASQYAQTYNIYQIDTDGEKTLFTSVPACTYTITNTDAGTYTYAVSAVNSLYGESLLSISTQVQIVFPTMTAPSNFTYSLSNGNDISLKWNAVNYATNYKIYQIDNGQKILKSTIAGTSITYTNMPTGNYVYEVYSYSDRFGESQDGSQASFTIVLPTMQAPGNLTNSITNGNDITLKWGTVPYAINYKVYQIVNGQKVLKSTLTGTTVTYTNMPGDDYVYEVHSYSDRFGESQDGSQATFTLILPTMQAPVNLTNSIINGNDITLKWGTVPYAINYRVYQIVNGQKVLKSTLTGTTVTYTNMPGDDYVYEVHSYSDRFGESQDGSQASFTLVLPTMQAPGNLSNSITNGNDITLKWGTVPYAINYKVYQIVNGQKVLKSTLTGTTVTYTNMPGGDYVYEVHSYSDRFGESQDGSNITFSLIPPVMQPPSNVVQTIKNATDFTLNWDVSPYATSYKVYQIINGQRVLKNTVTSTTVAYTNMTPGEYNFEIHSYSTRFGESTDGSSITVTLNGQIMQAPTNLAYSITNGNDITLKWTAAPYATSYKIYQVIDGQPVLKKTVTSTNVTFTNMPAGDYDYIVNSVSTLLGESADGAETTFSLVLPTMAAPQNLAYKIQNGNDIVLTWSAVTYASSYKIYESIDGQLVLKATVSSTSATLTNVPEGDHNYIVNSVSTRFGESQDGSQVSFTLTFPTMLAPGNFTYSIANGNDITLKWNAVNYATAYKIYQIMDGQKILKQTVTSTYVTFTNMPEGDYAYEVHSYSNRFDESQDGSQAACTLIFPTMQAPGSFTYNLSNGNDITLKWTSTPYATNYKIYQIVDGQRILNQTVTGTSVTFTNMPAEEYSYEIHSYSSRFGESQEESQTIFTLVFPIMQAPSNLTNSIVNGNDITLKWNASTYATAYRVYQILNGKKILKQTLTGTSITFVNMPAGDYSYEVDSYSSRFGESPIGSTVDFTLIWPVVQLPTLNGTIYNVNNITLAWQAVSWANEYRVYEVINGEKQLLYKGTNLSYKIFNLSEDTFSFQVTGYSTRFGESAPSNLLTANIIYPVIQSPSASLKLIDQTTAQISWNFITYANGYNVYEIIDNQPVLLVKNLNNLSYTLTNLSYANHQYYVTSYSNSFGESDASNAVIAKLIVDTEAPVTSTNAPTYWTSQSQILVNLYSFDKETGVAATYYSINDGAFTEGNSFIIGTEGINKISFYSIDKVGNKEPIQTIYIKMDKTAPITSYNAPTGWTKDDVTINLSASDELSGVAKTFYSIDDSNYLEGSSFTIQTEGIHKISFYSIDAAGNIESTNTAYIKIDKTAPTATMELNNEYKLGTMLQLSYTAIDNLSGIVNEQMVVFGPNETTGTVINNGSNLQLDKPGTYSVITTVTDAAGNSYTTQRQFVVYIPANIQVTSKVINGNNGVFTVRLDLPSGYSTKGLDLNNATLNGVNALTSNNGYYNQAKLGQFKFERSDFSWIYPEIVVEFRCYINGYLVIGQTTVKVQK